MRIFTGFLLMLLLPFTTNGQHAKDNAQPDATAAGYVLHKGLRLNFIDRASVKVKGANFAVYSATAKTMGLALGLVADDSVVTGSQIGFLYAISSHMNGLAIGGLSAGGGNLNGLALAGLSVAGDTLNGVVLSFLGNTYWNADSILLVNGLAVGGIIGCRAHQLNGLSLSFANNVVGVQRGVTVSAFNRARELHGFQFGLINYAGNNRRIFRWMPLLNFNLRQENKKRL